MLRLFWVSMFLFLNGILDVFVSSLRGMGYSSLPTIVMLVGICGVRLLWLLLIFPMHRTLTTIYLCFPLSWTVTSIVLGFIWLYCYRHMLRIPTDNRHKMLKVAFPVEPSAVPFQGLPFLLIQKGGICHS